MAAVENPVMTNREFAERVGCDHTMASRLRSGVRLPSARLMTRIKDEFNLDWDEIMAAYNGGEEKFGEFIRTKIYQDAA